MDKRSLYFDDRNLPVEKPPGNAAVQRVSAYAVVLRAGAVLLVRGHHSGMWELPGGGVEEGETFAECVAREGMEETGHAISVADPRPVAAVQNNYYSRSCETFFRATIIVFRATVADAVAPAAFDAAEIAEAAWVPIGSLRLEEVHPVFREAVRLELEGPPF